MSEELRAESAAAPARARALEGVAAERVISIASPLALLALWEALGRIGWLDQRFFPAPSAIAGTFANLVLSGELLGHVAASLGRVAVGFAIGAVPGVILGIAMGLSRLTRAALKPMVGALYPIPKTAIFPMLLLIFGLGEPSKWAFVAVGVFFLVLINTMAGVLNIEPVYVDVGKSFGARPYDLFRTVALPGALPLILAGLRLAWGNALLLIVVAETLGARTGIGAFIWNAWLTFKVEEMYSGVVTVSFVGYASFLLLDELQRWLVPWKGSHAT